MEIRPADLDDPRILRLLDHHVATARAQTGGGSAHALDHDQLRAIDIRLWAAWDGEALLGIGALRLLSAEQGEVKSMHVAEAGRRRGTGRAILRHIAAAARAGGMSRISLETGSWDYFRPAHALYRQAGFVECAAFGDYRPSPDSLYFTLDLTDPAR